MALIKSISGIRGTIGGKAGDGLSPVDVVKFTAAYATLIRKTTTRTSNLIVVGRDARLSGKMVDSLVTGTLCAMGFDVVNIGLASTPPPKSPLSARAPAAVLSSPHRTTPCSGTR